jgi:hypothetical protein
MRNPVDIMASSRDLGVRNVAPVEGRQNIARTARDRVSYVTLRSSIRTRCRVRFQASLTGGDTKGYLFVEH